MRQPKTILSLKVLKDYEFECTVDVASLPSEFQSQFEDVGEVCLYGTYSIQFDDHDALVTVETVGRADGTGDELIDVIDVDELADLIQDKGPYQEWHVDHVSSLVDYWHDRLTDN
jgi:hypothetical protein